MGTETPVGEIPRGYPPSGDVADGRHGHQISTLWDIGVYTHWSGAGDSGDG